MKRRIYTVGVVALLLTACGGGVAQLQQRAPTLAGTGSVREEFDPQTLDFGWDGEANALLACKQRAPWGFHC